MSSYDIEALMKDPRIMNNPDFMRQLMSDSRFQDPTTNNNMISAYLQREDALKNYYGEQTTGEQKKSNSNADFSGVDYQNTIDKLNQNLTEDTNTLNDKEGQNGTFGSSARSERMSSLAGKYNNSYQDAYNKAVNQAEVSGVNSQHLLGADGFNKPSFTQYGVNPTGKTTMGQSYKYNPFSQKSGSIAANQAYSLKALSTGK